MSMGETSKHVATAAAATAPAASYLSGLSLGITILAGLVSIIWMGASTLKMLFPERFNNFIKRINHK